MTDAPNKIIEKVGHYTTWEGDLTDVVVGNIAGKDFFNSLPDNKIKEHCQIITEQTKQDLDNLAQVYAEHNVNVFRPKIINHEPCIKTCNDVKVLNPRPNISPFDHIFCRDNKIVLTWCDMIRFEDLESIQHILDMLSPDIDVVSVRPPKDYDQNYYDSLTDKDWPGNRDIVLDGPTFSPAGKHIFYSKMQICSQKGIDFMMAQFPTAEFVGLDEPIYNHLDAQFRILKEGHVISCHPKNVLLNLMPQFAKWEIYHDDSWQMQKRNITEQTPMSYWLDDDENIALADIAIVHINPKLVVIQRENANLCRALERAKVDWIHTPIKYDQYFGLATSCATAILHRTDQCIDYFS